MVIDTDALMKVLNDHSLAATGGVLAVATALLAAVTNIPTCVNFLYNQALKVPKVKPFIIKNAPAIHAALEELEKDVQATASGSSSSAPPESKPPDPAGHP